MLFACPECLLFYAEEGSICPCGGDLYQLDLSRELELLERGFERGTVTEVQTGEAGFQMLADSLKHKTFAAARIGRQEAGLPIVRCIITSDGTHLWLNERSEVSLVVERS